MLRLTDCLFLCLVLVQLVSLKWFDLDLGNIVTNFIILLAFLVKIWRYPQFISYFFDGYAKEFLDRNIVVFILWIVPLEDFIGPSTRICIFTIMVAFTYDVRCVFGIIDLPTIRIITQLLDYSDFEIYYYGHIPWFLGGIGPDGDN